MTSFEPELWVESPGAAIAFYAEAFGATVVHQVGDDDELVAHLAVGEARFWVANSAERVRLSPRAIGGATGRVLICVDDPDAVLVSDEHGWRLGRITDPAGHEWEVGRPLGDWPPA
jgi:PhnB protein